jgi:hypothetical protein
MVRMLAYSSERGVLEASVGVTQDVIEGASLRDQLVGHY